VLASVTDKRINLVPETRTVGEIDDSLDIALRNGLFVHKDTPQSVRDKIVAVASETVLGDKAQQLAEDTGAQVYWQDAEAAKSRIAADAEKAAAIDELLSN